MSAADSEQVKFSIQMGILTDPRWIAKVCPHHSKSFGVTMVPFKIVHHWPGWEYAIYSINHISKDTYFTRISNNIDTIFNDGSVQLTNVSMIEFYSPVVIKLIRVVKRFDWPFQLKKNFTSGSWSVPFPRDEIPFSVIIIGYLVELYLWWK